MPFSNELPATHTHVPAHLITLGLWGIDRDHLMTRSAGPKREKHGGIALAICSQSNIAPAARGRCRAPNCGELPSRSTIMYTPTSS